MSQPHVTVEIISEYASYAPGRKQEIGFKFTPEPGWHLYWRNPGDTGLPPTVEWSLARGLDAGPMMFPRPEIFDGAISRDFGYSGPFVIAAEVSGSPWGDSVTIGARLKWLVCKESCIPGKTEVSMTLPVSGKGEIPKPSEFAPEFMKARALRPVPLWANAKATLKDENGRLELRVDPIPRELAERAEKEGFFFPGSSDWVESSAEQTIRHDSGALVIGLKRAKHNTSPIPYFDGVLAIGKADTGPVYEISVGVPPTAVGGAGEIAAATAAAFAGGVILNLMPCVFPVLWLKVLGLVQQARSTPRAARAQAIAYSLGVVASFWAVAGVLLALRAGGASLGWGYQLQQPAVVAGLALLMFVIGWNLLGVFEISAARISGVGGGLAAREGWSGHFFTGVLATVVATPCTAPFMGTAVGFAVTQPWYVALAIFTALGAGLAFPFAILGFIPGLSRFLPKPGAWMERFKQVLAIPIFATAAWLLWVLARQAGPHSLAVAQVGWLLAGLAIWLSWLASKSSPERRRRRSNLYFGALTAATLAVGLTVFGVAPFARSPRALVEHVEGSGGWERWSRARVRELVEAGKPVFVDFTADWCVTCQVNERVALETAEVRKRFEELGIVKLKADWTHSNAEITDALAEFGRNGVPLYLYYPAGRRDPKILPQILTPGIVLKAL